MMQKSKQGLSKMAKTKVIVNNGEGGLILNSLTNYNRIPKTQIHTCKIPERGKIAKDFRKQLEGISIYPDELLELLIPEGFANAVFLIQELNDDRSREPAYEEVEAIYEKFFGIRRYTSYECFISRLNTSTRKKIKKSIKK